MPLSWLWAIWLSPNLECSWLRQKSSNSATRYCKRMRERKDSSSWTQRTRTSCFHPKWQRNGNISASLTRICRKAARLYQWATTKTKIIRALMRASSRLSTKASSKTQCLAATSFWDTSWALMSPNRYSKWSNSASSKTLQNKSSCSRFRMIQTSAILEKWRFLQPLAALKAAIRYRQRLLLKN